MNLTILGLPATLSDEITTVVENGIEYRNYTITTETDENGDSYFAGIMISRLSVEQEGFNLEAALQMELDSRFRPDA